MSNLTDKFRPIEDFFLNNSDLADMKSVEIAAILVNYHPRPFLKYVKSNSEIEKEEDIEFDNISEKKLIINEQIEKDTSFNFSVKKKVAVGLLSVLGLFSVGYTSKELVFPTKECMQWQVDHYEEVDCDVKGIASYNDVIPIEGHQLKLKKIDVDSMTVFFKGEKPVVFYWKVDGKPEFFNQF